MSNLGGSFIIVSQVISYVLMQVMGDILFIIMNQLSQIFERTCTQKPLYESPCLPPPNPQLPHPAMASLEYVSKSQIRRCQSLSLLQPWGRVIVSPLLCLRRPSSSFPSIHPSSSSSSSTTGQDVPHFLHVPHQKKENRGPVFSLLLFQVRTVRARLTTGSPHPNLLRPHHLQGLFFFFLFWQWGTDRVHPPARYVPQAAISRLGCLSETQSVSQSLSRE